jgi:hypothetical protein
MGAGPFVGTGLADKVEVLGVLEMGGAVVVGTVTVVDVETILVVHVGDATGDSIGGSTGGSTGGTVTSKGPIYPVSL